MKDSLATSPPVVYYQFAPEVYNKPGDARRQKMSSPRFKKDKEIIADYESQVKGKGECAFGSGVALPGGGWGGGTSSELASVASSQPGCGSYVIKGKLGF